MFSKFVAVASAGAVALGAAACGGSGGTDAVVKIEGSSTVLPFAQAAAEAFQGENADVKVTVGGAGSTAGFEALCNNEIDVADASSRIDADTMKTCQDNGVEPIELVVANDGISIITNPDLQVDCITTDELEQVWEKGSTAKSLSEVSPDLPDTELALFGPGDESGTWTYFTETIDGEEGNIRPDYSPSSDDNVTVQGVEGEPGGFGFLGFSYYEQNMDALGIAAVDDGDGCIEPSAETIQSGDYAPLARPLFMYVNGPEALDKPQVTAFLDYVLANDERIAGNSLVVPANGDQLSESEDTLAKAEG